MFLREHSTASESVNRITIVTTHGPRGDERHRLFWVDSGGKYGFRYGLVGDSSGLNVPMKYRMKCS